LERVIEYDEVNGEAGYQPEVGGDRPCLHGITLLKDVGWSAFDITSQADAAGNTVYSAVSSSSTPSSFTLTIQFSTTAMSNNKTQLDPSSFKFSFDITDYVYNNSACAAGLAFRIFVINRGDIHKNNVTVPTDLDLSARDVYDVPDGSGNPTSSFYIYDRHVTDVNGTIHVLYSNVTLNDDISDVDLLNIPPSWNANTVWYSVPGLVTDFSWDPYALTSDMDMEDSSDDASTTSSGSTTGASPSSGASTVATLSSVTATSSSSSSGKVTSAATTVVVAKLLLFAVVATFAVVLL